MEIEERIRKVENTLSFLKGSMVVGVAAAIVYFGATSYLQIPNQIQKEIDNQIGEKTRSTISDALTKAHEFLAHEAHNKWPDGTYAILKSGPCPSNFKEANGYARAFSVFERRAPYLKAAKLGDSEIKWHKSSDTHVDLNLSVCIKSR